MLFSVEPDVESLKACKRLPADFPISELESIRNNPSHRPKKNGKAKGPEKKEGEDDTDGSIKSDFKVIQNMLAAENHVVPQRFIGILVLRRQVVIPMRNHVHHKVAREPGREGNARIMGEGNRSQSSADNGMSG